MSCVITNGNGIWRCSRRTISANTVLQTKFSMAMKVLDSTGKPIGSVVVLYGVDGEDFCFFDEDRKGVYLTDNLVVLPYYCARRLDDDYSDDYYDDIVYEHETADFAIIRTKDTKEVMQNLQSLAHFNTKVFWTLDGCDLGTVDFCSEINGMLELKFSYRLQPGDSGTAIIAQYPIEANETYLTRRKNKGTILKSPICVLIARSRWDHKIGLAIPFNDLVELGYEATFPYIEDRSCSVSDALQNNLRKCLQSDEWELLTNGCDIAQRMTEAVKREESRRKPFHQYNLNDGSYDSKFINRIMEMWKNILESEAKEMRRKLMVKDKGNLGKELFASGRENRKKYEDKIAVRKIREAFILAVNASSGSDDLKNLSLGNCCWIVDLERIESRSAYAFYKQIGDMMKSLEDGFAHDDWSNIERRSNSETVFINAAVEPCQRMTYSSESFEEFLPREEEAVLVCHHPYLCEMEKKTKGLQYSSMKLPEIEIKKAWKAVEKGDISDIEKMRENKRKPPAKEGKSQNQKQKRKSPAKEENDSSEISSDERRETPYLIIPNCCLRPSHLVRLNGKFSCHCTSLLGGKKDTSEEITSIREKLES